MAWPLWPVVGRRNAANNLKIGGEVVVWSALVRTLPRYVPLELTAQMLHQEVPGQYHGRDQDDVIQEAELVAAASQPVHSNGEAGP